jgi:tetratricopeptide (TPR) repeat protein
VHGEGERPARGAEVEPVDAAPAPAATAAVHWPVSAPEQRAAMQALDTTERALELDPDHPEALRDKAAALRRLDRPGEAADTLAHLVRLLPDSAADRLEYGSLLAEQSRWQAALEQFAALASLLPDDARAWHNLAVAHQALGHLRDAREAWDRVMAISPDAAAYAHRAEVAADMGDWQSAAADYEAARALDPTDVDFGVNLAWARGRLGRDAEARELLLELLKAHPSHVPIMNRLAELAWRRALAAPAGEQAAAREAAEWCRRSLRVDSRQPEVEALLAQAVAASDDSH